MNVLTLLLTIGCISTSKETGEDTEYDSSDTEISDSSRISIETTMGTFMIELDVENSPVTSENFQRYVDSGFFDGSDGLEPTLFHRVIPDFMIQGGGVLADGSQKETFEPIVNEASNGLSNVRGTVAMARTSDPNSATSQFFVNVVDNAFLDYSSSSDGYAVFATVVEGMDVVDSIVSVSTDSADRPMEDITIISVGQ
jgi:cyclophilin family peptidyl-prolyl cis-trans isomerase